MVVGLVLILWGLGMLVLEGICGLDFRGWFSWYTTCRLSAVPFVPARPLLIARLVVWSRVVNAVLGVASFLLLMVVGVAALTGS